MFVPWDSLNRQHMSTAMCVKLKEHKFRRWLEEESCAGASVAVQDYVWPLEFVDSLKYLCRSLTASKNYCPAVVSNFRDSQNKWERFSSILGQEGSDS